MRRQGLILIHLQAAHNISRLMAQVHQQEVGLARQVPISVHDTNNVFISDPVEAEAVSSAFFDADHPSSRQEMGKDPLYVGSIKTVLGHTEGYVLSNDCTRGFESI